MNGNKNLLNEMIHHYQKQGEKYGVSCSACLPSVYLTTGMDMNCSNVHIGAQDVFWLNSGAYTGSISAEMLKDVGVTLCLIGHSERRGRISGDVDPNILEANQDSSETVALKYHALLERSIEAIICVGETAEENRSGNTERVLEDQLASIIEVVVNNSVSKVTVAYEPVWAIGTGNTCSVEDAELRCAFINHLIKERVAKNQVQVEVLYGGSVSGSNVREYFAQKSIDGVLVGGASFKPEDVTVILEAASGCVVK